MRTTPRIEFDTTSRIECTEEGYREMYAMDFVVVLLFFNVSSIVSRVDLYSHLLVHRKQSFTKKKTLLSRHNDLEKRTVLFSNCLLPILGDENNTCLSSSIALATIACAAHHVKEDFFLIAVHLKTFLRLIFCKECLFFVRNLPH